jgi:uncharacterized protein YqeY
MIYLRANIKRFLSANLINNCYFCKNNYRMHLTIELPNDLETQLREQAQQKGKALNQYIAGLIREKVSPPKPKISSLTADETRLFQVINKGFSTDFWTKLRYLDKKRQEMTLTESENIELIEMAEKMESANVERLKALIELAAIRQIDLDILMTQLGLNNGKQL